MLKINEPTLVTKDNIKDICTYLESIRNSMLKSRFCLSKKHARLNLYTSVISLKHKEIIVDLVTFEKEISGIEIIGNNTIYTIRLGDTIVEVKEADFHYIEVNSECTETESSVRFTLV